MPGLVAPVGIMADSHGDAESIDRGGDLLVDRGCTTIYHLGDICDSTRPETMAACVERIVERKILAIKGNNDHSLVAALFGQRQSEVPREALQWLGSLPLVHRLGKAMLVHSLPFIRQRGLAAMIGVMGKGEAARFFEHHPAGICFRGHSHNPELIRRDLRDGEIRFEKLVSGERVELNGQLPAVITCGALSAGFCMLWRPEEDVIESLRF